MKRRKHKKYTRTRTRTHFSWVDIVCFILLYHFVRDSLKSLLSCVMCGSLYQFGKVAREEMWRGWERERERWWGVFMCECVCVEQKNVHEERISESRLASVQRWQAHSMLVSGGSKAHLFVTEWNYQEFEKRKHLKIFDSVHHFGALLLPFPCITKEASSTSPSSRIAFAIELFLECKARCVHFNRVYWR